MERDCDAVFEIHAGAVPGALDTLTPEERHRVYKMLRLKVLAYPDTSLEVSGAIVGGVGTGLRAGDDSLCPAPRPTRGPYKLGS